MFSDFGIEVIHCVLFLSQKTLSSVALLVEGCEIVCMKGWGKTKKSKRKSKNISSGDMN